jgi:hypothetical protein
MKKRSPFLAFIALFLGWAAYKQFDFETFRFKSAVGFVYIFTILLAAYFYFKPGKKEE